MSILLCKISNFFKGHKYKTDLKATNSNSPGTIHVLAALTIAAVGTVGSHTTVVVELEGAVDVAMALTCLHRDAAQELSSWLV